MAEQDDRDALAEVLAAHATVATGLGEWCCKCDPTTWRPSAHRARHLADAASDWLAQRDRRVAAEALRKHADYAKDWDAMSSTPVKPYDHGVRVGMRLVEGSLRDAADVIEAGDQ